mmetsp:Transcript_1502/g.4515  ORF Transcript_1502/g.4515 Transcript_1502/m.4515 type:complete len:384 (-) Transcript_1502:135-1286(-)
MRLLVVAAVASALSTPATRSRREVVEGLAAAAAVAAAAGPCGAASLDEVSSSGRTRPDKSRVCLECILPPILRRGTIRYDLGRGAFGFEQLLSFQNVSATVRMNAQRLEDGSLLVVAPVAPTEECLALLDEVGRVSHLVLPVTALEHKAFFGPFVRQFPRARVWVAPGQYGPFGASGSLPYRVDGVLDGSRPEGFPEEFDYKLFFADLEGNAGPVSEVALFHRPTTSLFVTDAVSWIPDTPSPLFATLYDIGPDFWPKTVLQAVFIALRQAEDGSWPAYDALRGRLIRAPILRAFVDVRAPDLTKAWVDDIANSWAFDRILAAHFASPVLATPAEFRAAFARLDGPDAPGVIRLDDADWAPLDDLNALIQANNLGAPILAGYK